MKRNLKICLVFVAFLVVVLGAIFGFRNMKQRDEKVTIVATNFPAYDFARAVAGDKAEVKMLIKPGAEVHSFEPSPQDIIDIKNSEMFIYVGGHSDEWVEDVLVDINADETKIFKMTDVVDVVAEDTEHVYEHEHHHDEEHDHGEEHEHEHEEEQEGHEHEYDEHVWTSLRNSQKIIAGIKDSLVEVSPENEAVFEENAKKYSDKLADLDQKFQNIVDNGKRKTIIFGDRFPLRYFVDDYGLDYYAAFPGCSEQTEASSQTIAQLTEKVKSENIPVVFKIEMSSGKIADTIANETGAKVLTFDAAHNISSEDFESGRSYAMIMEDNLKALKEALN